MTDRANVLPLSLAPRGLNKPRSAKYIGVGETKFGEMVRDRRMPQPKRIDGRMVWDRLELDEAFGALPSDDDHNPWDEVLHEDQDARRHRDD